MYNKIFQVVGDSTDRHEILEKLQKDNPGITWLREMLYNLGIAEKFGQKKYFVQKNIKKDIHILCKKLTMYKK